jgi:hypothetical protein
MHSASGIDHRCSRLSACTAVSRADSASLFSFVIILLNPLARRNCEAGVIGYDLRQSPMRGIICQIAFGFTRTLHLVLIHIHPRYRNAQTHSFLQIHAELR